MHNLSTKISLWSAPKDVQEKIDVMPPVVREQEKRERAERRKRRAAEKAAAEAEARRQKSVSVVAEKGDAGGGGAEGEPTTKKPRLEGDQEDQGMDEVEGEEEEEEEKEEEEEEDEQPPPNQPPAAQEFTEEDIAWQLEAMAEQYGLEEEDFEEGDELAPEESTNLFREMLEEYSISPYSTWDDALPRFVDDHRYTVLSTTKARKEVFTAWCKDKSSQLRQEKEKAKKTDPRIPFWDFLNEHTTSKLFWAEFKRKWRKEPAMRDSKLSDKEREKMYRDYVARLYPPPNNLLLPLLTVCRNQRLRTSS